MIFLALYTVLSPLARTHQVFGLLGPTSLFGTSSNYLLLPRSHRLGLSAVRVTIYKQDKPPGHNP